ncbi:hypothetical protein AcV5_005520 [Taiwanofungus camphoratus]|nr:hypothetical protein AcV5_005520 [Antrodia cinnamomea]
MSLRTEADGPHVVIIGGGLGGLCFGIALKQQLGFTNFTIYEKASDIGGTWRDNTYPGCGCDTPVHWYSLSTELNPKWSTSHVSQPELQAYWKDLAEKYTLYNHTVFNTKVISAAWNSERQLYEIVVEDVSSGKRTSTAAQIVISAIGYLTEPVFPTDLKGFATFKGDSFHSARWNHSLDLRNKKVAVIGNGASSAQFIPRLVADPSVHVVNFCRTPNWFVYGERKEYSALQKWVFGHVPLAVRLYRNWLVTYYVLLPIIQGVYNRFRAQGPTKEQDLIDYIKRTAPRKYHNKLIPNYPVACRRPVLDPGYLSCLHQPNVSLSWDGIAEITEDGVLTHTGEKMHFDVIIYATGFITDRHPVSVKGSKGETLEHYFAAHGGPTAYLGVSVPGFPNFYYVGGPNTVGSNGSAIFTHECEINYAVQLVAPVIQGLASSFEVKAEPCDAYNDQIQAKMAKTDWVRCTSWYRTGGSGKNFSIFPVPITHYWWLLRRPVWEHYISAGAGRWTRHRQMAMVRRGICILPFLLYLVWGWMRKDFGMRAMKFFLNRVALQRAK